MKRSNKRFHFEDTTVIYIQENQNQIIESRQKFYSKATDAFTDSFGFSYIFLFFSFRVIFIHISQYSVVSQWVRSLEKNNYKLMCSIFSFLIITLYL